MRKFYFLLIGILSFIGINTVSADTYIASDYYSSYDKHVEYYNQYKENVDYLIDYWENNHSSEFPYYFIIGRISTNTTNDEFVSYILYSSSSTDFVLETGNLRLVNSYFVSGQSDPYYSIHNTSGYLYTYQYRSDTNSYTYSGVINSSKFDLNSSVFIIDSNVLPTFKYKTYTYSISGSGTYTESFDTIQLSSFTSTSTSFSTGEIEIQDGDNIPTLVSLYDGTYEVNSTTYKEINLNDYAYVALSLNDYDTIPENNYSTYSSFYVKGQLCITPVYNYGMTERKDILTGSQIQGCSEYYNDFTLTRMYILPSDVKNHAIYYLKAYDTSKENIVKVDTSMFNISYILTENEDYPEVTINGKIYPTLSYNSLTDTATKSEDEGYISGVSCAVGDFNCYSEYNTDNIFDNIFSSPLDFLKDIWGSVTSIFSIITEFISLLPPTMQSFLYLSFMIAVILGLIKILL